MTGRAAETVVESQSRLHVTKEKPHMKKLHNNPYGRASIATLCLVGAMCFSPGALAQDGDGNGGSDGWDWMIAPYGWMASIRTDLETTTPPSSSSADSKFDDIVDKLDGAFQAHVEGQGDRFGVFADFTYLGLADEGNRPRFHTESDLDTRLFEVAAVWNPGAGRFQGLDLFGGLRYIDIDLTAQLEPENPLFPTVRIDANKTYSDLMLGARYTWAMSDRWGMTLRGDGSWGDTEGTWNASAVVQYRTQRGAWLFGYRYLDAELESGNSNTRITMYGPQVGYGFRF